METEHKYKLGVGICLMLAAMTFMLVFGPLIFGLLALMQVYARLSGASLHARIIEASHTTGRLCRSRSSVLVGCIRLPVS